MAKANRTGRTNHHRHEEFKRVCSETLSAVLSFFIFFFMLIFSLRYTDHYFNILETKTRFYIEFAGTILIASLALGLIFLLIDAIEFRGMGAKQFFSKLLPSNWKATFPLVDAAIIIYLVVSAISTLQSDFPAAAFQGTQGNLLVQLGWRDGGAAAINSHGRYSGLLLNLLYGSTYLIISRFWRVKNYVLEAFLLNGALVCLLGITDYFQLDLLHFRERMSPSQYHSFMSTIGNINTYTAYVALVMGFAAAMYLATDHPLKRIWYDLNVVISFFAIIMGLSDNAYLSIGTLFAFMPLLFFKQAGGVSRYVSMAAALLTAIWGTHQLNLRFPEQATGQRGIFPIIAGTKPVAIVCAALWLIYGAMALAGAWRKKNAAAPAPRDHGDALPRRRNLAHRIWLALLLGSALILLVCLYDANANEAPERYGALADYLRFSDRWGSTRGYIWRKSMEAFSEFPLARKIVGFGPDTFWFVTLTYWGEEATASGQAFDSAHNEYLHLLLTVGIAGLLSYLVFLGSLTWKLVKASKDNPYVSGILWAILCYLAQALVNINLPVVTPMLWVLMGCGMAFVRDLGKGQKITD